MSLDGISSKMMIQRAAELAKELHGEQKKLEVSPFIRQLQAETEIIKTQVRDVYKPDEAVIRRDQEKKKKRDSQKTASGSTPEGKTEAGSPDIGHGNSKIDIRI